MKALRIVHPLCGKNSEQPEQARPRTRRKAARLMLYGAAFVMFGAFIAPLWHYNFTAPLYPEYPDGLAMTIYVNHIEGQIDLINELNHYIGMRTIDSNQFLELRLMPWLFGLLALGAVILASSKPERLGLIAAWLTVFATVGLGLLGDFYWWLYTYGHDLDPHAAIRIPPFMPRIIGSYTLLGTFHVRAWPGFGVGAIVLSFLLGLAAFAVQCAGNKPSSGATATVVPFKASAPGRGARS